MPSHKILRQWQSGNQSVSQEETVTADSETNLDLAVDDGETALEANIAIDVSALASLYMAADQDITIKTNSSGSPDDTISLKANKPLVWTPNCGFSNPLSVDVLSIFCANSSGTNATLQIRLLQDATP